MSRLKRKTRETTIEIVLERGDDASEISTGDTFLDHMVDTLVCYAGLRVRLRARGDLRHHLVEDVAIILGLALADEVPQACARFGWAVVPMDDALVRAAVDVGGRSWYQGRLPSRLYEHFLQSLAVNLGATLHVEVLRGRDKHHVVEAAMKATGLALCQALARGEAVFSTKGSIELERDALPVRRARCTVNRTRGRPAREPALSLHPRVVVCLDVKDGRVVKGTRFEGLRDVGDPVELAARYEAEGADEIVYLDISASKEERGTLLDVVRRTAEVLFVPLTVGGGVRAVSDIGPLLRAGADKVSVNTAAVRDPALLTEGARRFGSQCIVISVDAACASANSHLASRMWRAYTHGGSEPTDKDAVAWAAEAVERGAGEVLLTSIDNDGVRTGYDLELTRTVARRVRVPVVASGGAGRAAHLRDAFLDGGASAALVAGILHEGLTTVGALKSALTAWGVNVRRPNRSDLGSRGAA